MFLLFQFHFLIILNSHHRWLVPMSKYNLICGAGEKSEPPHTKVQGERGRYKRTKVRNLVERLIREQNAILAFAFNEEVPFTNNLAERDISPAKVK